MDHNPESLKKKYDFDLEDDEDVEFEDLEASSGGGGKGGGGGAGLQYDVIKVVRAPNPPKRSSSFNRKMAARCDQIVLESR